MRYLFYIPKRQVTVNMSVEYKGKIYKSISALAKEYGVSEEVVYMRLHRGFTLDEALLNTPYIRNGRHNKIEYNGKIYSSIKELLELYNIPQQVYYRQLKKGATLEDVINGKRICKPIGGKRTKVEYDGQSYSSIREFAIAYNISPMTVYSRIYRGWSISEIANYKKSIRRGKTIEYEGKIFNSIKELSIEYGIKYSLLERRLNKGLSVKEAIENEKCYFKKRISSKCIAVELNGIKYDSISDFARKNNLPYEAVIARFRKGLTPEEVLNYKRECNFSKQVEYNGEIYSSRLEFAKKFNIPYHRVSSGLNAGHSPEQIIEAAKISPIDGRRNPKLPIEFNGKIYETLKELAEDYNMDFDSFRHKVYCGLSIEEALGIYDLNTTDPKEIWKELIADEPELSEKEGYEILRELRLDKNIDASEFDEIEDFERQKWMYIK